jgi:hypothetical protein
MRGRHEDRRERLAAPCVAAHRERAQRVAVIALAARDEVRALRLADFHEVLARHLERRLHRLGTAAHQVHVAHAFGRGGDQFIGQLLGHFAREEAGVGVGQRVELRVHGGQHLGVRMAERRNGRATRGIEVFAAFGVADEHAVRAGGNGWGLAKAAVKDVRHGVGNLERSLELTFRPDYCLEHLFRQLFHRSMSGTFVPTAARRETPPWAPETRSASASTN